MCIRDRPQTVEFQVPNGRVKTEYSLRSFNYKFNLCTLMPLIMAVNYLKYYKYADDELCKTKSK